MAQAPTLPSALPEVQASAGWHCIDFISDLHLSALTPRTASVWARFMRDTPAQAVFILGDLFEAWVGDDARHTGFEASCVDVLREAAAQRHVAFMVGNRDFLAGPELLQACGVHALPDPTLITAFGQRVLLTHGDALCLADAEYQQFRTLVRSAPWQRQFLAQALDERRRLAQQMRDRSEQRKQDQPSPELWADVDAAAAVAWLRQAGSTTMIHGHTHRPGSTALAPGYMRHVLSDWDLDQTPPRGEVLRWSRDGFKRCAVAQTP